MAMEDEKQENTGITQSSPKLFSNNEEPIRFTFMQLMNAAEMTSENPRASNLFSYLQEISSSIPSYSKLLESPKETTIPLTFLAPKDLDESLFEHTRKETFKDGFNKIFEEALKESEESVHTLKEKLQNLDNEKRSLNQQLLEERQTLENEQNQKNALNQQLQETRQSLENEQNQKNTLNQQLLETRQSLENEQNQKNTLNQQLQETRQSLENEQNQKNTLNQQLQEARNSLENEQSQKNNLTQQLQVLKQQLEKSQQTENQLKNVIVEINVNKYGHKEATSNLEKAHDMLQEATSMIKKSFETLYSKVEQN